MEISRKSDYAVILFVRAFPGNFPETFFGFPEKKTVCHRNILGCVTGKIEKPSGGRYKLFREYWLWGTLPRPDSRYTDFCPISIPPKRNVITRILYMNTHTKLCRAFPNSLMRLTRRKRSLIKHLPIRSYSF